MWAPTQAPRSLSCKAGLSCRRLSMPPGTPAVSRDGWWSCLGVTQAAARAGGWDLGPRRRALLSPAGLRPPPTPTPPAPPPQACSDRRPRFPRKFPCLSGNIRVPCICCLRVWFSPFVSVQNFVHFHFPLVTLSKKLGCRSFQRASFGGPPWWSSEEDSVLSLPRPGFSPWLGN